MNWMGIHPVGRIRKIPIHSQATLLLNSLEQQKKISDLKIQSRKGCQDMEERSKELMKGKDRSLGTTDVPLTL